MPGQIQCDDSVVRLDRLELFTPEGSIARPAVNKDEGGLSLASDIKGDRLAIRRVCRAFGDGLGIGCRCRVLVDRVRRVYRLLVGLWGVTTSRREEKDEPDRHRDPRFHW